jgi:uncharacterized membrane protein
MSVKKTFIKTLSYGVMHMSISILVAYALSRDWRIALAIGLIEPCVQTVAFFFHERAWHRIEKQKEKDDYHDSVIDSASPASSMIEKILWHKH